MSTFCGFGGGAETGITLIAVPAAGSGAGAGRESAFGRRWRRWGGIRVAGRAGLAGGRGWERVIREGLVGVGDLEDRVEGAALAVREVLDRAGRANLGREEGA